jgi:hypothetical protein
VFAAMLVAAALICSSGCRLRPPLRLAGRTVPRYGHFELAFEPDRPLTDPWVTDASVLGARFECPSGRVVHVPAFRARPHAGRLRMSDLGRAAVTGLKIYVAEYEWPGRAALTVVLDDVRLVNTRTGEEKLLGDFEHGLDGWEEISCAAATVPGGVRGERALRMELELTEPPSWPGLFLDVDTKDWRRYDELRFTVRLESEGPGGPVQAEWLSADGRKVVAGGALRGALEPGRWTEAVWRLGPGRPELARVPEPAGEPAYAVRFMPAELGAYRFQLRREGHPVLEGGFECVPSELAAPLAVSRSDPAYFARADGEPWLAIGENVCWYGPGRTLDYDRWLARLANAGGNYCRIWLAPWGFQIEWDRLGRYGLKRAWELDYVLALARELNIAVMLCLDYHGSLRSLDGTWAANPYNAANGGPCARPADFFTDPEAERLYRRRLRYLVARYACYSNLLAWELFNEVELTDGYLPEPVAAWHDRTARYLRSLDPHGHLVTTSFGNAAGDDAVWSLPVMDFVQSHRYDQTDWAAEAALHVGDQRTAHGKPMLFGEFGIRHDGEQTALLDPFGVHLHNGLWGSVMAGGAGTAMTWWWDSYVDPRGLYGHFASLSRFLEGVRWDQGLRPLESCEVTFGDGEPHEADDVVFIRGQDPLWEPAPINRPHVLRLDAAGALDRPELLSRVLQGTRNHPHLHNPVSFLVDLPAAGTFWARVHGVSGRGGAALRVMVDGQARLDVRFPDRDPTAATTFDYARWYSFEIARGPHSITLVNDGPDWVEVSYAFKGRWRREEPNVRVMGLKGPRETLVWLQNRALTYPKWAGFALDPSPVEDAVLLLPELPVGRHELTVWDTWWGGELARRRIGPHERGPWELPAFTEGLALRFRRLDG